MHIDEEDLGGSVLSVAEPAEVGGRRVNHRVDKARARVHVEGGDVRDGAVRQRPFSAFSRLLFLRWNSGLVSFRGWPIDGLDACDPNIVDAVG